MFADRRTSRQGEVDTSLGRAAPAPATSPGHRKLTRDECDSQAAAVAASVGFPTKPPISLMLANFFLGALFTANLLPGAGLITARVTVGAWPARALERDARTRKRRRSAARQPLTKQDNRARKRRRFELRDLDPCS